MHRTPSHWKQIVQKKIKHSSALKELSEYLLTAMDLIYILLINPISWVISFPFYWLVHTTELDLNPGLKSRGSKAQALSTKQSEEIWNLRVWVGWV